MKKEIKEVDCVEYGCKGERYEAHIGDEINFLTIQKLYSNKTCDCICRCGTELKGIRLYSMRCGNTKSCGCYNRELTTKRNMSHGDSKTRLYKIWLGMKKRCYNPNSERYDHYGGKGIVVCDEWLKWENFKAWANANGYEENLTIERKDYDKDYCPENCEWIPLSQQANNRSMCHLITVNGETHNITEWSKITGLSRACINSRLQRGWSEEKAITTPKQ